VVSDSAKFCHACGTPTSRVDTQKSEKDTSARDTPLSETSATENSSGYFQADSLPKQKSSPLVVAALTIGAAFFVAALIIYSASISYTQARIANETSAIRSLREINSAQAFYAASCGRGFYAPSLAVLATPSTEGGGEGFISSDLSVDPSIKSGYQITLTAGPAALSGRPSSCEDNPRPPYTGVSTYFVAADPLLGVSDESQEFFWLWSIIHSVCDSCLTYLLPNSGRYFGTNGGTIYENVTKLPVTQTGTPPNSYPTQLRR
jgi:hypothetical protein